MENDGFDPTWNLITSKVGSVGYHTTLKEGVWAHPTRESLAYAQRCYAKGDIERAHIVVDTVLGLQELDPTEPTYGIWSWFADEPLAQMSPPDWNWADFLAARMLEMLLLHRDLITPKRAQRMEVAIGHAAWSIFRRNVGPDYTNIAIMGAMVCAAAGELLHEPRLITYAKIRFEKIAARANDIGGLAEYNSPTYTIVAIEELERALLLCTDPGVRAIAEKLHGMIWGWIADRMHPATHQWGGPHSRAYSDLLSGRALHILRTRTGLKFGQAEAPQPEPTMIPAPAAVIARCQHLPSAEITVQQRVAITRHGDRVLTTWMNERLCLGSVNHDTSWIQRRPLIAYAPDGQGGTAVLKLRFVKNNHDFASGYIRSAQQQGRVLCIVSLVRDQGDHHCHLDKAADGRYAFETLAWRWELTGVGARVEGSAVTCGDLHAQVVMAPATWRGQALVGKPWQSSDGAAVGVQVDLASQPGVVDVNTDEPLVLVMGLSLDGKAVEPIAVVRSGDGVTATWGPLTVSAAVATPLP